MNLVHKIETWGNTHHPVVLDPIRIALGLFLVFKGVSFMNNTYTLHSLISNQNTLTLSESVLMCLIYLVIFVNLFGGIMIALGILTRMASLANIPVMVGAVIMTNAANSPINTDLWLAVVVLAMLVVFSIVGSGKLSIEKVMENVPTIFR
jgi:putative oxidoreductase